LVWVKRPGLLAWYHARQLAQAEDQECAAHLASLEELGAAAIPALVGRLRSADARGLKNCRWGLVELARNWGPHHPAGDQLVQELAGVFPKLAVPARAEVLAILEGLLRVSPHGHDPETRLQGLCAVIGNAARTGEEDLRPAVIRLAGLLLNHAPSPSGELLQSCRTLTLAGLKDQRAECRASAVRLAAAPGVEALDRVAALVLASPPDPSPEVRSLALLAVGGLEDLAATDDLLPFLHDPDPGVRGICEQALRSRGLNGPQLQLARLMTDPQPTVRAQVPSQVQEFPDLDAKLWLDRLSQDTSPAVRAAVLRASAEMPEPKLQERMAAMAKGDPSPTVRQLALYYLAQQQNATER
jgi:hypothetical protein